MAFFSTADAVVVFRRNEHKAVGLGDFRSPLFDDVLVIRRPAGHRGRHGLIEEWHREIAEIEEPHVNRSSLPKLLKDPVGWLFRKPPLACTADDYGNGRHMLSFALHQALAVLGLSPV